MTSDNIIKYISKKQSMHPHPHTSKIFFLSPKQTRDVPSLPHSFMLFLYLLTCAPIVIPVSLRPQYFFFHLNFILHIHLQGFEGQLIQKLNVLRAYLALSLASTYRAPSFCRSSIVFFRPTIFLFSVISTSPLLLPLRSLDLIHTQTTDPVLPGPVCPAR